MPSNDADKKRWKDEAQQLKKDLDGRPKSIVKREVPTRFGGIKKKPHAPDLDQQFRKNLGI